MRQNLRTFFAREDIPDSRQRFLILGETRGEGKEREVREERSNDAISRTCTTLVTAAGIGRRPASEI